MRAANIGVFPVVGRGESFWPKDAKCPVCGKSMVTQDKVEQVVLCVGALKKRDKNSWEMDKGLGGFMGVFTHCHGKNTLPSASLDVVDLSANGQADLAFCSTKCMRGFFNKVVDELERRMKKEKRK